MDLKDLYIKEAVKNKNKLIIDTDAHHVDHYGLIRYGIAQARRGWDNSKDIINTCNLKEFKKFFNIK